MSIPRLTDYLCHMQQAAHGYFDINLEVVWDTVQAALPELLRQLPDVQRHAQRTTGSEGNISDGSDAHP
jgi:uncharacterized protein with HEPN domain